MQCIGDILYSAFAWIFFFLSQFFFLCVKEKDLTTSRKAKVHEEMKDMEASLRRAKLEASLADGISWGMDEDAIEENEVGAVYLSTLNTMELLMQQFISLSSSS